MSRFPVMKLSLAALAGGVILHSQSLLACAACYGASDSPLAQGMNWGIFSLLAVVGCVLSGFASFGIYLARKSAAVAAASTPEPAAESTQKV